MSIEKIWFEVIILQEGGCVFPSMKKIKITVDF